MEFFCKRTDVATDVTPRRNRDSYEARRRSSSVLSCRSITSLRLLASLSLALLAFQPGTVSAHRFEWYDGVWAHEETALNPNPSMTFGRLDNGLRWVHYPSTSNPGQLTLRLNVQAGSLMEEPHESGAAHYLQHLAKEGLGEWNQESLRFFLNTAGISLTRDFTSRIQNDSTVFGLNLPGNDELMLKKGLGVLRRIADGIRLDPKTIQTVRSEIINHVTAENRLHDNVENEWRHFLYEGTTLTRSPLGELDSVKSMTPETLRAFYRKWYIPGRMSVVVVGNIDPTSVGKLVNALFGNLSEANLPYPEDTGTPAAKGIKAFVRNVPAMTETDISINILPPLWPVKPSQKLMRLKIVEDLMRTAVQRRLDRLIEANPNLWFEARAESTRFEPPQPVLSLKAKTFNGKWRQAMKALGKEFISLRSFGITQHEFDNIKKERECLLRRLVNEEQLAGNDDIADRIVKDINANRITFSAQQELDLFLQTAHLLTLENTNLAITTLLKTPNRVIEVVGANKTTEDAVLKLWKSIEDSIPEQKVNPRHAAFPYLEEPLTGPQRLGISRRKLHERLDFVTWETDLPNGIKVYFQPLTHQKGRVRVDFLFGDGLQGMKANETLIPRLAIHTLAQNGIGRLSKTDSDIIFRSRHLRIRESLGTHHNVICGEAQSKDLHILLQAVWTQFRDPLVTEKNLKLALNQIRANEYKRKGSVIESTVVESTPFFAGFDPRTLPLKYHEVTGIGPERLCNYLHKVRNRGEQILFISGDFDISSAASKTAQLFAALPITEEPARVFDTDMIFPEGQHIVQTLDRDHSGRGTISMGWRADLSSPDNRREVITRSLVAEITRRRLRSKLASVALPGTKANVIYRKFQDFDGFGYLLVEILGSRDEMEEIEAAVREVTKEMMRTGVTDDELTIIREPLRAKFLSKIYTNAFWSKIILNTVSGDFQNVNWFGPTPLLFRDIGADEVNREIRRLFSQKDATLILKSAC